MEKAEILELVRAERRAQNAKWSRTEGVWKEEESVKLTVLAEEVGEVVDAFAAYKQGGERKYELELFRGELVQVAAVIVSWLEDLQQDTTENTLAGLLKFYREDTSLRLFDLAWCAASPIALGRVARSVLEKNKQDTSWRLRQFFVLAFGWLELMEVKP